MKDLGAMLKVDFFTCMKLFSYINHATLSVCVNLTKRSIVSIVIKP